MLVKKNTKRKSVTAAKKASETDVAVNIYTPSHPLKQFLLLTLQDSTIPFGGAL